MNTFGERYSKLYDLLYKDKNYQEEFQYVLGVLEKHASNEVISILDIGCGTGKYLKLFKNRRIGGGGMPVIAGIDISSDMLNEAKKYLGQEYDLICCKASEFQFNKQFDAIISLFHVMSYQIDTSELEAVFQNVSKHLTPGGLFLFDFWYGPAVLSDPPVVRIRRLEDEEIKITRIAEPTMHYNENIAEIHYQLFIESKKNGCLEKLTEIHKMRYFFLPEIKYFSFKAGLSVIDSFQWMSKYPLSNKSWYGFVVLKKI